ncbi:MAG: phospholipase D-like domain-containing protein [Phormidesmis sp. CAN_BIN44]|nr:phospholipase D-like domain-containing protein [Phormidesmis sp. CAN_BIN44]
MSGLISSARHRIKIAPMVITSHTILSALDDAVRHAQVKEFGGTYNATQMNRTVALWMKSENNAGVAETFKSVASYLAGKHSAPYEPTEKHNFLHNKVVVCDDAVVTGSFNFSRNATMNAENVLVIHDATIANQYSQHIDQLIEVYGQPTKKSSGKPNKSK